MDVMEIRLWMIERAPLLGITPAQMDSLTPAELAFLMAVDGMAGNDGQETA